MVDYQEWNPQDVDQMLGAGGAQIGKLWGENNWDISVSIHNADSILPVLPLAVTRLSRQAQLSEEMDGWLPGVNPQDVDRMLGAGGAQIGKLWGENNIGIYLWTCASCADVLHIWGLFINFVICCMMRCDNVASQPISTHTAAAAACGNPHWPTMTCDGLLQFCSRARTTASHPMANNVEYEQTFTPRFTLPYHN